MDNAVTSSSVSDDSSRVPSLDGLRGVAITLVLLFHFTGPFTPDGAASRLVAKILGAGWTGVDLFFALSGYLITKRLIAYRGTASERLLTFYRNRFLRIFPLYYLFLIVYSMIVRVALPSYWLYYCNWTQPFDIGQIRSPLSHLWSLAVEEQFYLLWPLALILAPRRRLIAVAWLLLAVTPLWRSLALLKGASPDLVYRATIFRVDALLGGVLVALTGRHRFLLWAGLAVTVTVTLARQAFVWSDPWVQALGFSGTAWASAGIVGWAAGRPRLGFVSSRPAVMLGRYSYGIYILHWPLAFAMWMRVAGWHLGLAATLGLALLESSVVVVLAALSFELFERRVLAMKRSRVLQSSPAVRSI